MITSVRDGRSHCSHTDSFNVDREAGFLSASKLYKNNFFGAFSSVGLVANHVSLLVISGSRQSRVKEGEFGPIFIHLCDRYKTIDVERFFI